MPKPEAICVYCGSQAGKDADFMAQATQVGSALALSDTRLVYGGGDSGLMGAVARAVLEGGGAVHGVIPQFLIEREQARGAKGLDGADITVVEDMHTRKHAMFAAADGFLALPGGIGTLEELVEILTWAQLGRHDKPVVVLDAGGFWQPLAVLLDHMDEAGFLHNAGAARPVFAGSVSEAMAAFGLDQSTDTESSR